MLVNGDCSEVLKTLPSNSIDALVTDPPAGISFMSKAWDHHKGGRLEWIAWMRDIMRQCKRVMKPGAHGLVWAIPRTSHWTATACEDAGFEIRDVVTHIFGSGFPKSLNICKAIDNAAGAEREVLGPNLRPDGSFRINNGKSEGSSFQTGSNDKMNTAPATPEAKQWEGWGTALKPASEHWILIRKPIEEDTVAKNVLKHGTGGINVDASRIGFSSEADKASSVPGGKVSYAGGSFGQQAGLEKDLQPKREPPSGRFPANLILSHNSDCVEVGTKKVKSSNFTGSEKGRVNEVFGKDSRARPGFIHADADGTETVSAFECTEFCPVAELDWQSGVLNPGGQKSCGSKDANSTFGIGIGIERSASYSDTGGASRFFYCAKPSKREKNLGCEANTHPTVKSTKLMDYLINMITPLEGTVLDPFMGSGTAGVSAMTNGFKFIGIEKETDYFKIAEARMNHVTIGDK